MLAMSRRGYFSFQVLETLHGGTLFFQRSAEQWGTHQCSNCSFNIHQLLTPSHTLADSFFPPQKESQKALRA